MVSTPQLFPALWGFAYFHMARAQLQTARELGEEFLRLAQRLPRPAAPAAGPTRTGGDFALWLGEFVQAQRHMEQGLALYDPDAAPRPRRAATARTPAWAAVMLAQALWLLGYPDQALAHEQRGADAGPGAGAPLEPGVALTFRPSPSVSPGACRPPRSRRRQRSRCVRSRALPIIWPGGRSRGWALAAQGQVRQGIAQIRQGFAAWRATGADGLPYCWPCWPRRVAKSGSPTRDCASWRRRWRQAQHNEENRYGGGAVPAQGRAAAGAGRRQQHQGRRRSDCFSRPSPSPAASRRSRWSCGRP